MLIWFMHGATVRQSGYADPLRSRLIAAFDPAVQPIPDFCACFWGDLLAQHSNLWDCVEQDLATFQWEYPNLELEDIFHYRQRREQLVSGFFNDIFTYLNPEIGQQIRRAIAVQFLNFLADNPGSDELHIIAHSLGSVILWDILFSDRMDPNDPAHYIRDVIKGLSGPSSGRKVRLRSITTLGSPLLFFNRMLAIHPQQLHQFARRYTGNPLRWVNIVHASDIFAYPIRTSLEVDDSILYLRDLYLGERNFLKQTVGDLTMAIGITADHTRYWRSRRVAALVLANLQGNTLALEHIDPILQPGDWEMF